MISSTEMPNYILYYSFKGYIPREHIQFAGNNEWDCELICLSLGHNVMMFKMIVQNPPRCTCHGDLGKKVHDQEAAMVGLGHLYDFMMIHCRNTITRHQLMMTASQVIMSDHE